MTMPIFADETEALDWLRGLHRHSRRLDAANPRVQEIIHDAVRYLGAMRFNDTPIERVSIAQASGLPTALVDTLLETKIE